MHKEVSTCFNLRIWPLTLVCGLWPHQHIDVIMLHVWLKFVIKLDSLSPIHRFIGQAMSWGKYWARRYVEPNIFPTHGETNKFVYWMKSRIQFYHYYVLRILCPISLYTFLNKQISNKREKNVNYNGIQNYFQFKLPNHGKGTCEDIDTISMQWNQKTQGTTWRKRVPSKISFFFSNFFNHIIILNLNDKIMWGCWHWTFQCDGTKTTLGTT